MPKVLKGAPATKAVKPGDNYALDNVRFLDPTALSAITNDPYEGSTRQQSQRRVDVTTFSHKANACLKRSDFAKGVASGVGAADPAPLGAINTMCWVAPEADDDRLECDTRGVFNQLHSSNTTFENTSDGNVTVLTSAPKTKAGEQSLILRRDKVRKINIKPGAKFSTTIGFSGKKSVNYPVRVGNTMERAVLQYAIIIDDINQRTGKPYDPNAELVRVTTSTAYSCKMAAPAGYTAKQRSEFSLRPLSTIAELNHLDRDESGGGVSVLSSLYCNASSTWNCRRIQNFVSNGRTYTAPTGSSYVAILREGASESGHPLALTPNATGVEDVGRQFYLTGSISGVTSQMLFTCINVTSYQIFGETDKATVNCGIWFLEGSDQAYTPSDPTKGLLTTTVSSVDKSYVIAVGSNTSGPVAITRPTGGNFGFPWAAILTFLEAITKVAEIYLA